MDAVDNPYTPNAGARPEILIGRDEQTEAFRTLLRRLRRGRTDQSMIITGLRGVGKTVLLNSFRSIAQEENWEVIEFEAVKHGEGQFRQVIASQLKAALLRLSPRARWSDRGRNAAAALSAFAVSVGADGAWSIGWDVPPAEGLADHRDLGLDLTDVLVAVGEAAAEQGEGIVLLIDEVQFLDSSQLEALIQAIHKTVQRNLPVTFVGAGLPQIAELAGDAKSYAERLFTFPRIGSLHPDAAAAALREPAAAEGATYDDEAVELAVTITRGYPYFIQELGYQVWTVATANRITQEDVEFARDAYEAKLDSSFFRVRLDRATQLQTAYMRAMAELGPEPQKAGDVAALLERSSQQLGPTRAELIDMGLLYTPEYGYAAFTVPDFDRFMKRAVPHLEVPPIVSRGSRRAQSTDD
ncbi:ATP-binding protein [Rathayibacter iranicus]|uniref:ATP-binding protein n=2 Tax=Rathayibacter iranicus TaxID=59737 RepID=A0AAD1AGS9_9MICO|nr:ATP-binding protein [Rathayibacter iranicus]AZZ56289.1 ATP-binding protein [Rathayibacter iranicus]MWV29993.1 AAA family ATPase [Rathayibacter iranicus NCPPB 2253 = VKM Ac-1602]PPI45901.1 ATP-binding protein [Rathayibacter iranicus]PPI59730.1 ATP-binding protein [Rathayibacter iranicus]PPI70739.1 ATP-binding protein [Rathayibacter iranicus]